MRYRGGGVGHTYMRVIEQWLWATGWGCKIPDAVEEEEGPSQQKEPILAEDSSDSGSDSDDLSGSDEGNISGSGEGESDEEEIFGDEETLEGELGYSTF